MANNEMAAKIAFLGGLCGITSGYWDNFGRRHHTSLATYQALLTAMGVPWEDPLRLDQEIARRRLGPWNCLLEPVQVATAAPGPRQLVTRLWTPTPQLPSFLEVRGELISESGVRFTWEKVLTIPPTSKSRKVGEGFRTRLDLPLPPGLEPGYYDLSLEVRSGGVRESGQTRLIVAPEKAYAPDWLAAGRRGWGFNLPLYALRSQGDWGMGDFGDLLVMIRWAASLGAAFVGVNPLHAPGGPQDDPSPYSPTSRIFLNFLYLDLETVPEMAACREAQDLLASPEFQASRARLQNAPLVPYPEVYRWKRRLLELLYRTFCDLHGQPETSRTPRGREFARFLDDGGELLERFGRFGALADFFGQYDWRRWPEAYQHPGSPAVADFARSRLPAIRRHQYGQWLAAAQLNQVCEEARTWGLPFTLYEDLALGASPGGFDTWAHQELFARGAAIGAPPDAFNPKGQNWGLPPLIPERLRQSGYRLFIETLRANTPPGGMLRLDHVMGLFRLFWVPPGQDASQGAYVVYPARELLAILALESVRRRALIIGEDLGTVPSLIRRKLGQLGVLSYKVFYFERDQERQFLPPEAYPPGAVATVTTHDLPTLAGFCQGRDLALKRELHLYPDARQAEPDARDREQDRRRLLEALQRRGLLPEGVHPETLSEASCPPEVRAAVLEYLAQSGAALLEVRLEEVFGVPEQQNLPGTTTEHPNWRLKLPLTLEQMEQSPEAVLLAARLNKYRGRNNLEGES